VLFETNNAPAIDRDLSLSKDGYFYSSGNLSNNYYIVRMNTNGLIQTVATFTNGPTDGAISIMQASDGSFYGNGTGGDAYDEGTVFKMTTSGLITTLYLFYGDTDGYWPGGILVEAGDGNLYGVTRFGGPNYGNGTIFRIVLPKRKLSIAQIGDQITVSWPTNFPGLRLQSTTDLNSAPWEDFTNALAVNGNNFTITNRVSGTRFFRLR
jgi:uncharacterized repeat protein (TIGR03803 family)